MKLKNILPGAFFIALLAGCSTRHFEDCPDSRVFGDWGVVNDSQAFGFTEDSLYYVINPVRNVLDTLYYNGDYTDSYFHSDSTRIILQYLPSDSIRFFLDRMYAVETNPQYLSARVRMRGKADKDSVCTVRLKREGPSDQNFSMMRDSLFMKMIRSGKPLDISITNSGGESDEGSRNYRYILYTEGFTSALSLCDSLNHPAMKDSVKNASSEHHHKK